MAEDRDDSNPVATGALFALLHAERNRHSALTAVELLDDAAGNHIDVRFGFLRSAYRLTVERVPETENPDEPYCCDGCGKTSRIARHEPGCPVAAPWRQQVAEEGHHG